MGKGAVSIVAGYWPEDVHRYLQVPNLSLDEAVVMRPSRRRPDHPALICGGDVRTYRELADETEQAASRLRTALGPPGARLALALRAGPQALSLLLGAMRAGYSTLVLDHLGPAGRSSEVGRQLGGFGPDLIVAEGAAAPGWRALDAAPRVIELALFWDLAPEPPTTGGQRSQRDLRAPVVALVGADQHLVYHSHTTLASWAVSFSAFVPLTEESVVLDLEPLHKWGGLAAMVAALFRGATCRCAEPDLAGLDDWPRSDLADGRTYAISSFDTMVNLERSGGGSSWEAIAPRLAGVFATVGGAFSVKARRRVEADLGVPILTILGSAEAGPAVASHPSWYVDESVGIPLTNVDLWPLDPATGRPLAVPWEAIEFAELGARSPMTAVDLGTPSARATDVHDRWLRLGTVATMDPNGLFYLRA